MTPPVETSAARTRRRWVTIGEVVAVLALLISAASFWDTHQEHVRSRQGINAAVPSATTVSAPLLLSATISDDRQQLTLRPAHAEQVVETQTLHFPAAVRAAPVETTGNPRIESGWFEDGLRRAVKVKAGDRTHRLAVGVDTSYVVDGVAHTDRAVYDIGYELRPRFLRGTAVDLEGISLARSGVGNNVQAQVEARWAKQHSGA